MVWYSAGRIDRKSRRAVGALLTPISRIAEPLCILCGMFCASCAHMKQPGRGDVQESVQFFLDIHDSVVWRAPPFYFICTACACLNIQRNLRSLRSFMTVCNGSRPKTTKPQGQSRPIINKPINKATFKDIQHIKERKTQHD